MSEPRTPSALALLTDLAIRSRYYQIATEGKVSFDADIEAIIPQLAAIEDEAGRAVQDDGLDVERLAQAMEACGLGLYHATEPRMLLEQSLPVLVAEYSRLRSASALNASGDERS